MLRGLKLPLHVLDAFLAANGILEEREALCEGCPPRYRDDSNRVTLSLRQKTGENTKTQVFMPYKQSMNLHHSSILHMTVFQSMYSATLGRMSRQCKMSERRVPYKSANSIIDHSRMSEPS